MCWHRKPNWEGGIAISKHDKLITKSSSQKAIDKVVNILLSSITFIFLHYLLACWMISFNANVLSIFLTVINAVVIGEFWGYTSQITNSKIVSTIILIISIVIVVIVLLIFGYFPISTTLQEVF